jgi:hypothetical protein
LLVTEFVVRLIVRSLEALSFSTPTEHPDIGAISVNVVTGDLRVFSELGQSPETIV